MKDLKSTISTAEKSPRSQDYNVPPVELLRRYHSERQGLKDAQVEENRQQFGVNRLQETTSESLLSVFIDQFKDLLVIILILAALLSLFTKESASAMVIFTVLVMNAILGTMQYFKAQRSLESLKKLSSPEAKVLRNGQHQVIPAEDLVCGDIILLEAGDIVPGDARILECFSLKVNESSLTGESEPVEKHHKLLKEKDVALGDQKNMVFSGSLVTYGRATALVTRVGTDTELGRIATLMNDTRERKTPLQVAMDNFSKKLSVVIMVICALVFGLSLLRAMPVLDALLFAVALAVAAIPEALSSIITISLAIGTSRMAAENAIVKDLNAVEGLGCVSIICSDKTGTLTQNKMTVEEEVPWKEHRDAMLLASVLCNDTRRIDGAFLGDPTETAYFDYFLKVKGRKALDQVLQSYPRLEEVPFDSDRKLMSTLHHIDHALLDSLHLAPLPAEAPQHTITPEPSSPIQGKPGPSTHPLRIGEDNYVMFTKGALDVILERTVNLTAEEKESIRKQNFQLSDNGLRVLGFAMAFHQEEKAITIADENNLIYLGCLAEVDPPRQESAQAVADCMAAGIKPIMITGDHKVTASAIARRIGILQEGDLAFTGPEIDQMDDDTLREKLPHISVYARVSPDNKIRIVQAWQDLGHIVAMTGDGVNDAPALKSADVGVAMGITGTEVAKDSAAMILTDDNFATIVEAVLNGRNIYTNIKNAILYLLSGNLAAILVVLFASIAGLSMPFTAVQLLFINLVTDSLPALAISMEPLNPALLTEKPRSRSESVLNRQTIREMSCQSLLIFVAVSVAFLVGLGYIFPQVTGSMANTTAGTTLAFATLCLARLWHGFNCRGKASLFQLGLVTNLFSIGAFVLGALLLHGVLFLPLFTTAFGVTSMSMSLLGMVWALAFLPTVVIQLRKLVGEKKATA